MLPASFAGDGRASAPVEWQTARHALFVEPQALGDRRLAMRLPVGGILQRSLVPVHSKEKANQDD